MRNPRKSRTKSVFRAVTMNNRLARLALILFLAAPLAAQHVKPVTPYSFKGFTLLMSLDAARQAGVGHSSGPLLCDEYEQSGLAECHLEHNEDMTLYFVDGRLAFIDFYISHDEFDAMVNALTRKHGKPEVKRKAFQNGFGARFIGHELNWYDGVSYRGGRQYIQQSISLDEYRSKIDRSGVMVLNAQLFRKYWDRQEKGNVADIDH